MYITLTIFIFLAAIFLILIVLVQNSKGGGLASGFSASNQVMGVRKTTDFLEKGTWVMAAIVIVLCVATSGFKPGSSDVVKESIIKEEVQNAVAVDPNVVQPGFGAQADQTQAEGQSAPVAEK